LPVVELNVIPAGSAPVSVTVGAGNPVVLTVNDPACPTVKVAVAELVMAGDCRTVSVNDWLAVPEELVAVNVSRYVPPVAAAGVPDSACVAGLKLRPAGSAPDSESVGAG
jgi:hypothetical protein